MADIRMNQKRMPILSSIDNLGTLLEKCDQFAKAHQSVVTSLLLNGIEIDLEQADIFKIRLDNEDVIEARMETPQRLSFESLQVAQELAELLVFDIKVTTLQLWDKGKHYEKLLETLISDCQLFLTLAAKPVDLLGHNIYELPMQAEACLRQLDAIAGLIEDATLLAVHQKNKEACQVLVARVMPSIEKWLSLSAPFAKFLQIDHVDMPTTPQDLSLVSG